MSNYYDEHAKEYINDTFNTDMYELYNFFEKHLNNSNKLLDIGFGSARDMLYFKNKGFEVEGIDPQPEFYYEAKKLGLKVDCCTIEDYSNVFNEYDCIWASASMHHIPKELLNQDLKICSNLLKDNGIMYLSVKYGEFEGFVDDGRYFNYLTEKTIIKYLDNTGLKIIDILITDDKLNRDNKWLNVILKKALGGKVK